ncbi:MAG: KH domain-containing protein [Chlamydiales bacterium]|nr:KH domain-containing protein [Chlamydiales bacterium]
MQEFVAYLVKNLVDVPDSVAVQIFEGTKSTIIEVKVSQEDIAKLVGRQGRTIKALRTIAMTVGARFGRRIKLELVH